MVLTSQRHCNTRKQHDEADVLGVQWLDIPCDISLMQYKTN
jgi:hypothetical protein